MGRARRLGNTDPAASKKAYFNVKFYACTREAEGLSLSLCQSRVISNKF